MNPKSPNQSPEAQIRPGNNGIPCAAVICDFDGLLADTEMIEFTAWAAVYEAAGQNLSVQTWLQAVGYASHFDPVAHLNSLLPQTPDWVALKKLRIDTRDALLEHLTPLPGALELLDTLETLKIPIACVSNSDREWVTSGLRRIGLEQKFPILVTRDQVANPKPAPDPYLEVLSRLGGIPPQQTIALEDSAPGVLSASRAGLHTIAIPNRLTRQQDLSPAHEEFPSLTAFHSDFLKNR